MSDILKQCFKCKEWKPLSEFYKHSQMADGHLNKCKECTKLDTKHNRQNNIDYYRAYDRKRGNRQTPEYSRKYNKQRRGKTKAYKEKHPHKRKAHIIVGNAMRDGKLQQPEQCEQCGKVGSVQAHHEDYSKPLDVVWLCSACHGLRHRKYCPFCNKEIKSVFGHNCPDWKAHHE